MNLTNLSTILSSEPAYRFKQVGHLLYKDLIDDWNKASNLPKDLKEKLAAECPLEIKADILKSGDRQAIKALITLDDGSRIETVLMRHSDKRRTICLSSQVGCPLGCSFCATGMLGFKRNLTKEEIIEQAIFWARYLKDKHQETITNIVFMGMGEPFLNYDNVLGAIKNINDKDGLNIGARHISISTVGLIDGIKKLAKEKLQVNLAISLHAPNDHLRSAIMSINKRYPLNKLLSTVDSYIEKTGRRVMIEYLLIKNVNDNPAQARELIELVKKPLYLVNLILYNETGKFQPAEKEKVKIFKDILEKAGIVVTERHRFGSEIAAACGQLALKGKCK
jgi:23S rRNA (adenine2503-C2)-methyltransferase